jgi:hypothetical protein
MKPTIATSMQRQMSIPSTLNFFHFAQCSDRHFVGRTQYLHLNGQTSFIHGESLGLLFWTAYKEATLLYVDAVMG